MQPVSKTAYTCTIWFHKNSYTICCLNSLSCGTSWHAAGLIGQIKAGMAESKLAQYSRNLYKELEENGHSTGEYFVAVAVDQLLVEVG